MIVCISAARVGEILQTTTHPPRRRRGVKKVESGWLLERREDGKIIWLMLDLGMWDWTEDSSKALRFAREKDADAMSDIISDAEYVTEHQWG